MRIPAKVRALVLARDRGRCVRCSQYVRVPHLQHRQARGMGGTSLRSSYSPANLLTLCSTCHLVHVERNRAEAERCGYIVRRPTDPASVRVLHFGRWAMLDSAGGVEYLLGG